MTGSTPGPSNKSVPAGQATHTYPPYPRSQQPSTTGHLPLTSPTQGPTSPALDAVPPAHSQSPSTPPAHSQSPSTPPAHSQSPSTPPPPLIHNPHPPPPAHSQSSATPPASPASATDAPQGNQDDPAARPATETASLRCSGQVLALYEFVAFSLVTLNLALLQANTTMAFSNAILTPADQMSMSDTRNPGLLIIVYISMALAIAGGTLKLAPFLRCLVGSSHTH
ncbi:hypothetical protein EDD15DRAFT_2370041 [Pisolithus albus]|nr:hypothetical protein EDD15DRAFT_2370041 [Pisolithus albus]